MTIGADVAIVGSGFTGALVARELLAAGRRVVMLERGGLKSHAAQLRDGTHAAAAPGAAPNHESAGEETPHPWNYVYGVGGASLHWTGVAPRFQPSDFRMRSAFGVMRDWPLEPDDLAPFLDAAERALTVAGSAGAAGQMPAHPLSPMDEVLAPLLAPYSPLPQARPTLPIGARPACCGAAACELCPVDARTSVLNAMQDVLGHPELDLRAESPAVRVLLAPGGRRAIGVEALDPTGDRFAVEASDIVLAAGGFENPALLLRSGVERPDTGRFLFDHSHKTLLVTARRPVGAGRGSSIATGASQAFIDGDFRAERSAAFVSPYNPGIELGRGLVEGLVSGRRGVDLRRAVVDEWERTVPLDILLEDVPQASRRIELSPRTDAVGLPCVRVTYGAPTAYEDEGWRAVRAGLEARLAPLEPTRVEERPGPAGSHLLGTCRMGSGDDGVVDGDLRHLDVENLWVAGGSAFPTYSPAHPTLVISALALRLGAHLAGSRAAPPRLV